MEGVVMVCRCHPHSVCRRSLPGAVKAGTFTGVHSIESSGTPLRLEETSPQMMGLEGARHALAVERPMKNAAPESWSCQSFSNVSEGESVQPQ